MAEKVALSEIIKSRRKQENITQIELGERCGVSRAYIQQIEKGKKSNPSIELIVKLGDALKISIEVLQPGITEIILKGYSNLTKYS